jgi:hypothetical protein
MSAPMTKREYNRIMCRMYHLPSQLERARKGVKQLEAECIHYGMKDLLTDPEHANRAFEREFARAKAANTEGDE